MPFEVNLALVTAPPRMPRSRLCHLLRLRSTLRFQKRTPAAQKESLVLQDLANDAWILFAKRVHPLLHEAIMDTARRESIAPKYAHDVFACHSRQWS